MDVVISAGGQTRQILIAAESAPIWLLTDAINGEKQYSSLLPINQLKVFFLLESRNFQSYVKKWRQNTKITSF